MRAKFGLILVPCVTVATSPSHRTPEDAGISHAGTQILPPPVVRIRKNGRLPEAADKSPLPPPPSAVYLPASTHTLDEYGRVHLAPLIGTFDWEQLVEEIPLWIFDRDELTTLITTLGPVLSQGASMVYTIPGYPQVVIKYQAYCGDLYFQPVEGIPNEARFLQLLSGTGIANKYLYFSRGVELPANLVQVPPGKLRTVTKCDPRTSLRDTPLIRYLITERVGKSLAQVLREGGPVPIDRAIGIGTEMLKLIQRIHRMDIIHGDVHPGNFAYSLGDSNQLLLIDFGRANIIDDLIPRSDPPVPSPLTTDDVQCHAYTSPWESRRLKPSFRDDLFRVLLVMAELIHGPAFPSAMSTICAGNEYLSVYWVLKMEENFFDVGVPCLVSPGGRARKIVNFFLSKTLVGESKKNEILIAKYFRQLLREVRSLGMNEKPDYHALQRLLLDISLAATST